MRTAKLSHQQQQEPGFGKYIERMHRPGHRTEAMIRGKGIPVWAIAAYVLDLGLTSEEVVADWEGDITVDEIEAAMRYYRAHPEEIERRRERRVGN